jgi:hypothetical protein
MTTRKSDGPEEDKSSSGQPDAESNQLSVALELLGAILENGANHNRRYCVYCKVSMAAPRELHRKNCVWRRALELVNKK